MAQITEDYVSFETAKLLKEKGFNEDCHAYWDLTTETKTPKIGLSVSSKNWNYKWNPTPFPISAPTLQMVMKWLREVYNIIICPHAYYPVDPYELSYRNNKPYWKIRIMNIVYSRDYDSFNTYEKACDAAIKYCLENLI